MATVYPNDAHLSPPVWKTPLADTTFAMNEQQAHALAEFVHDHDKRYVAKAHPNADQSTVLLTHAADGTTLPPVEDWVEYQESYIDKDNPGPTVRDAWDTWLESHASAQ